MQQREIFETRASTYPNAFWSIWQICCFCFVCCMIYLCICVLPVEARDLLCVFFLHCFLPYLLRWHLSLNREFRDSASTRDPPIPARPALGFRRMPGFLGGLGPRACHASLLTELLRRLSVFFLYSFYSLQNWKISWSNTFTQAKRKV